jgi:hypothetical protein
MTIILKNKKRTLTQDYIVKVAKSVNSNMYLEWQDIDEKRAIQIAENVVKINGYTVR